MTTLASPHHEAVLRHTLRRSRKEARRTLAVVRPVPARSCSLFREILCGNTLPRIRNIEQIDMLVYSELHRLTSCLPICCM